MKKCINCGAENIDSATQCNKCGAALPKVNMTPPPPPTPVTPPVTPSTAPKSTPTPPPAPAPVPPTPVPPAVPKPQPAATPVAPKPAPVPPATPKPAPAPAAPKPAPVPPATPKPAPAPVAPTPKAKPNLKKQAPKPQPAPVAPEIQQPAAPAAPSNSTSNYEASLADMYSTGYFSAYFFKPFFRQFFGFKGRTSRKSFWMSVLFFNIVIFSIFCLLSAILWGLRIGGIMSEDEVTVTMGIAIICSSLIFEIPSIALCIRRLRDAGKAPALVLLAFLLPVIGNLILLIFLCKKSVPYESEEERLNNKVFTKFKAGDWVMSILCFLFILAGVGGTIYYMATPSAGNHPLYYDYEEEEEEEIDSEYSYDEGVPYEVSMNQEDIPGKLKVTAANANPGYVHDYTGTIDDRYAINLTLDFANDEGTYYYVKNGGKLNLSISYDPATDTIEMFETNAAGDQTGYFYGHVNEEGDNIFGTFTNYKGQEMPFDIYLNDVKD